MNHIDEARTIVQDAVRHISEQTQGFTPEIGIILGSGLGHLADSVTDPFILPYSQIPGFPDTTVFGHAGRLVLGMLKGRKVMLMQGRFHAYEGHSMAVLRRPVEVMDVLGVKKMIVTAATGSANLSLEAGDLLAVTDHLNLSHNSPLRGLRPTQYQGPIYSPRLTQRAIEVAAKIGITLKKGVYGYVSGPNFETPAEVRMIRKLGGDVVGMSTVPEALTAVYRGIEVLGITYVSNLGSGLSPTPLTHDDIDKTMSIIKPKVVRLLTEIVGIL